MSIFNESNSREVSSSELRVILDEILNSNVPNDKAHKAYISSTDSYRHLFFANAEKVDFIEFGDLGGYDVEPTGLECGLLNLQVRSIFDYKFKEIKVTVKPLSTLTVGDVVYCKLDVHNMKRGQYGRAVTSTVNRYTTLAKKVSEDTFRVLNDIPALY